MIGGNNRRTTKKRKAFTVIEAVVVLAIFSILVVSFSEIYIRTSQSALQTANRARVQADARTMLESVVRAARVSNIDYATYAANGVAIANMQPVSELNLVNPDANTAYQIKLFSTDVFCGNANSNPCLAVSTDGGVSWSKLSPLNAKIIKFTVVLSPATDPFVLDPSTGTYANDVAPLITVNLGLQGYALRDIDKWTYSVQTTITPRYYKR